MIVQSEILSTKANDLQKKAANPKVSAWVSASAGSGKTKVLTDRILRLLLSGVDPETILCLTFTKAAAAEMANRLTKMLRKWVIIDHESLQKELVNLIGNDVENLDDLTNFARTLFAKLLDVKGGFKIMTIHSFCQNLLKRFPIEAGVSPSFDIIEEQDAKQMLKTALLKTLSNPLYEKDLNVLSEYVNEKELLELFDSIKKNQYQIENLLMHSSFDSLRDKIYSNLDVSPEMTNESLERTVCPDGDFNECKSKFLKKDGEILVKILKKGETEDLQIAKALHDVLDKEKALLVAQATCAFLHIVLDVLKYFNIEKESRGVLDYNDLILRTGDLLNETQMTSWVLYKLDGGIDHILLDEAQDTSPEQWRIICAITEEFFSGIGRKEDKIRTFFAVGDKKQSIYHFQGADAKEFERVRQYFSEKINGSGNVFEDIRLNISFRSTQAVLDMVNMLLQLPDARKGVALSQEDVVHLSYREGFAGCVEVWPLEKCEKDDDEDDVWQVNDLKKKDISAAKKLSDRIAERIKKMLDEKEILSSVNRPIQPGDIMILLRSRERQGIIDELLKSLKKNNIPVSGIDRLILNKHIAIQDLLSLASFLLLPDDDLSLAEILKSPMFNLSEEELYDLSADRKEKSLWSVLYLKNNEIFMILKELLSKTDVMPPFELFSYTLDVLGFRQKFLSALGNETNEMLDEFLNLCLKFEQNHEPSLESFVQFMNQDDIEIKRDLDNSQINAVRIMTVHGSKGLQSKIVFIPDAYSKIEHTPSIFWKNNLPIWVPKASLRTKICQDIIDNLHSEDDEEYNRLLYVALTRAEDRLYICGFETKRKPAEDNWYNMVAQAIPSYTEEGAKLTCEQQKEPKTEKNKDERMPFVSSLPDWFEKMAKTEPVVSKPLSPSKLLEDTAAPSPLTPEQEKAMERGSFIHKLLQYLPDIPELERKDFVEKNTPSDILLPKNLLNLFDKEEFKKLFGSNSLAEVPLVGITKDNKVISGQIDRLVIMPTEVLIIDYKTNRYPPKTREDVPLAYIEQLNAYKDLLNNIFPDKTIKSYLLWTTDLTFMEI